MKSYNSYHQNRGTSLEITNTAILGQPLLYVKTSENIADLAIKSKNMVVLNPVLQKASRDQSEPESVIQESHLTDRNAAPRDIVLTEVKISEGPFTYSTTNFQS